MSDREKDLDSLNKDGKGEESQASPSPNKKAEQIKSKSKKDKPQISWKKSIAALEAMEKQLKNLYEPIGFTDENIRALTTFSQQQSSLLAIDEEIFSKYGETVDPEILKTS